MYRLRVIDHFASAHFLRDYEGKCENLHGHNWKVEVYLKGEKLDKTGMLVDFKNIKKELRKITDELDHIFLNEHPYFEKINPTSENIAKYIYDRLKEKFCDLMSSVVVWESETAAAEYYE
ncbi:6-pyruvoyl-tetrahydropterin synthase [Deferribacter desulfuricans SSM1]|uniref:6-carboxy-5,6,7,8-tetrahydropterin synthase n=1 Tax=Deferribacter desulfuricans (strain DSM 14783 / JCM 11476 / NBRC 101012 / SSM1) TaxID=639282 RepID=D3PD04_DEFDS|nr:6-carboxytetrahydropterin synthase QueD [Deferribacter desulfuricans]BAI80477.1 6-pyruvoyl-tetrahydropterin synthase [Deferribacter desulfuricans SSM1]